MAKSSYERLKKWREANPEKVKLQRRKYQLANWDRIREYQRKWQAKKKHGTQAVQQDTTEKEG